MNSSQQLFRLHWKNHSPNFITCFSQLLNSESLVDVTLAADGKQIQAHRVVLSACSTYFQELFVSHSCQHPIVILKDINFKDLCTIIHFMYYGEVNIQHDQLNSILKTAEALRIKGFADVTDKESFSSALLNEQAAYRAMTPRQPSSERYESMDEGVSAAKRKRQRHDSGNSQAKSSQDRSTTLSLPQPHHSRREAFQSSSREGTSSSFRSSQGSFDNVSVIKSQSSLMGQTSMESNADESFARDEVYQSHSPTNGGVDAGGASENGASGAPASLQSKQKRNRPLMRQERVTKKEGEKDGVASGLDSIRSTSPVIHNFQPILPKSPKHEQDTQDHRVLGPSSSTSITTYLQVPPAATQLIRQRSQPSPTVSSGITGKRLLSTGWSSSSTSSSASFSAGRASTTPPPHPVLPPSHHLSFLAPSSIPTVAVTPVGSTPNIVIEQYPTILRVVSIEEMNAATASAECQVPPSPVPVLARTPSQSGNTLQVPSFTADPIVSDASLQQGSNRSKARTDDLKRSYSNPGLSRASTQPAGSSSGGGGSTSSNGHCPVLRTGAALGCNFCWNTNDSHGRILRRKTKYHCPDCQANLCIVPCFQEYHEKFVSTSNDSGNSGKTGGPSQHKSSTSHQVLSKMSSI